MLDPPSASGGRIRCQRGDKDTIIRLLLVPKAPTVQSLHTTHCTVGRVPSARCSAGRVLQVELVALVALGTTTESKYVDYIMRLGK